MARFDSFPTRELGGGLRVVSATTRKSRGVGLARLEEMPAGLGLELSPCRSIHTFGMRFALDLVWLRDGAVVRIDRDVRPRQFRTCLGARSVIEVAAGTGDQFALRLTQGHGGDAEHDDH